MQNSTRVCLNFGTERFDASLANLQNAQWYIAAMQSWSTANNIKTILFEAYDEPWTFQGDSNSETHFGIWQALGASNDPGHYTLTGEQQKYAIDKSVQSIAPSSHLLLRSIMLLTFSLIDLTRLHS